MEGLETVKYLIKRNDWLVKLDLQDAYFTVPIAPEHHKYLRLFWRDTLYEYKCLPFGLSSAHRVFTKLLKPVMGHIKKLGF